MEIGTMGATKQHQFHLKNQVICKWGNYTVSQIFATARGKTLTKPLER